MFLEQDLIVSPLFVFPLPLACIPRMVLGFSFPAALWVHSMWAASEGALSRASSALLLASSNRFNLLVGFPLSSHAASGGICPMFMAYLSTEVSDSQDFRLLGNLQLHFQKPSKNKEASFQIVWWWYLILISSILRGLRPCYSFFSLFKLHNPWPTSALTVISLHALTF